MVDQESEQVTLEKAEIAANQIAFEVRQQGVTPALDEMMRALAEYQDAGHPLETLLPEDTGEAVSFGLEDITRDAQSFGRAYIHVIRRELCKEGGEMQKLVKAGLSSATGAVITSVMVALALPAAAIGVAVPIAGIIAALGIDAFCQMNASTEPDGSGGAG